MVAALPRAADQDARPLGQHDRPPGDGADRARIRRGLPVLRARRAARGSEPGGALRAPARRRGHQPGLAEQRERPRPRGHAADHTPGPGGAPRGDLPRPGHLRAAVGLLRLAAPAGRAGDLRPAGHRGAGLVAAHRRRGLRRDPRLRRLRGQGRLGGPARPVRLRPRPRRRREPAGTGAGPARRGGVLAGLRLRPPPGLARSAHRPGARRARSLRAPGRPLRRPRDRADQARRDGLPSPKSSPPRAPVSPVIGAMPRTRLAVELQVTQEYTGQQKHLCYLAPWWSENLRFPFGDPEAGAPTLAQLVAGTEELPGGLVAVSNVGADEFWTGHPLAQANLFALGRLAWDPQLTPDRILQEWIEATFGTDPLVGEVLRELLSESWQLYEQYTAPLGVGFMVRPGHHYGPDVDGYEYTPWGTYHFADRDGIGVDRSVATGTGFAGLFPEPWASRYEDVRTCPDELLLFFHHVPYTHRLHSGKTVIQHIYDSRADAYEQVLTLRRRWQELAGRVPSALHQRVEELLREQERSAEEWRDQLRTYFHRASGIPDASGRPIY